MPWKQIKSKFIENKAFKGFFVEINQGESGLFAAVIIQIKTKFCLGYMLLGRL